MWDDCAAGDYAACDNLAVEAQYDSSYRTFGETCGERIPLGDLGRCQELLSNGERLAD